jgi:ABC-2 type transport system ATP-binding protein
MPIIEVRDLSKHFRTFRRREGVFGDLQNLFVREYVNLNAVYLVSYTIDQGEILVYIGANVAGK